MNDLSIVSEITVSYKPIIKPSLRKQIITSKDSYELFYPFFEDFLNYKECFYVMFLNKANKAIGVHKVSDGSIDKTVCDQRLILGAALKCMATSIILAHNHPSGNVKPSQQDIDLTKAIKESAELMDILIIDHLIIADDKYYSLTDNGLLNG